MWLPRSPVPQIKCPSCLLCGWKCHWIAIEKEASEASSQQIMPLQGPPHRRIVLHHTEVIARLMSQIFRGPMCHHPSHTPTLFKLPPSPRWPRYISRRPLISGFQSSPTLLLRNRKQHNLCNPI